MEEAREGDKLKVFVSYSRRDLTFTDRLFEALKARGFDVLIDRQNLPKLEDWERELLGFIQQADTVVFIVSRHSLASKVVAIGGNCWGSAR
jgi:TIR domain